MLSTFFFHRYVNALLVISCGIQVVASRDLKLVEIFGKLDWFML